MAVIEKDFLAAKLDGRAPIEAVRFVQIQQNDGTRRQGGCFSPIPPYQ
jgi:hypothetical protein